CQPNPSIPLTDYEMPERSSFLFLWIFQVFPWPEREDRRFLFYCSFFLEYQRVWQARYQSNYRNYDHYHSGLWRSYTCHKPPSIASRHQHFPARYRPDELFSAQSWHLLEPRRLAELGLLSCRDFRLLR